MENRRRRHEIFRRLMAIRALDRFMTSGEWERRLLVLRQSECGRSKALDLMRKIRTRFFVGRGGELPGVLILMAIRAVLKLDFVNRALALRDVTRSAFQFRMLPQ